jgi:DNA-binding response OmpR family regulator
MQKVLIVDDNAEFRSYLGGVLKSTEFSVTLSENAESAQRACDNEAFDMILLDLSLPDKNGFEFLSELRKKPKHQSTVVVFLSENSNVTSKLAAYSLGADDYIVKGMDPLEFRSKVEAKLRNLRFGVGVGGSGAQLLVRGELRIDLGSYRACLSAEGAEERDLGLTILELKLLHLLAKNDGKVLSRDQILSAIWGEAVHVFDRVIDTHVYALRKKLGTHSHLIESVQNVGYRFVSNGNAEIKEKPSPRHARLKSAR